MTYFYNTTFNTLYFWHRDSNQGKIAYKATTAGWVWFGMPSHTHTCLDSPDVNLVGLGDRMATLEVIQNKRLIEF